MARYLVTGGAGFIGSHLVDALLADHHQVRVLDDFSTGKRENLPSEVEIITGDVADAGTVMAAITGTNGCFHLAAIASVARGNQEWLATHRVNLGGTIAVLDAARALGGLPVVYASSAAVYGDLGQEIAREDCVCRPSTAYGADKYGSELHAKVGYIVHLVPSVGLRFFNVYGPRQDPSSPYSGVISIFADRIARGSPITLHGDGSQTRDFVFVLDVVAHLLAAMKVARRQPEAQVLNVCTGRETSILELARILGALARREVEILAGPARAGDILRSLGAPDLARLVLGCAAEVGLAEGLGRLLKA